MADHEEDAASKDVRSAAPEEELPAPDQQRQKHSSTSTTKTLLEQDDIRLGSPCRTATSTRRPNSSLTPSERREKLRLKRLIRLQSRISKIEKRIRHARSRRDPHTERRAKLDLVNMAESNVEAKGFVSDEFRNLLCGSGEVDIVNGEYISYDRSDDTNERAEREISTSRVDRVEAEPTLEAHKRNDMEQRVKKIIISISNELFRHLYDGGTNGHTGAHPSTSNCGADFGRGIKRKHTEATNVEGTFDCDGSTAADASTTTAASSSTSGAKEEQTRQAVRMLKAMTKGKQEENMFQDAAALW